MKVVTFLNNLGLGGTEKAACRWACGLRARGHDVTVLSLEDGPRRAELERHGVPVRLVPADATSVVEALRELAPQVIHTHAPGHPHRGDVLGEALVRLPKIPVVQTNVFGHLYNPREDAWTDYRLFISWTSCVQAARRVFRRLDETFFRRASVAAYPVDRLDACGTEAVRAFRAGLGVRDNEVLFGRLSRPDPNKWTDLPVAAFRHALQSGRPLKLLLREPPPSVAERLRTGPQADRFVILPATAEPAELQLTMSALDVVLHTSSIGESFGYGIAEPMNLGRPVVTHSVPWQDQAQLELVRHGACGFVASTPRAMARAMLRLAEDANLRQRMGAAAQQHIRALADPETSLTRLERILQTAIAGEDNPFAAEDLRQARETAAYLDAHQFGHSLGEKWALWPHYVRARLHQWRQNCQRQWPLRAREVARPAPAS